MISHEHDSASFYLPPWSYDSLEHIFLGLSILKQPIFKIHNETTRLFPLRCRYLCTFSHMPHRHWLIIIWILTSTRQATIWIAASIYTCDNNFSTSNPNKSCSYHNFILLVDLCGEISLLPKCDSGCHKRLFP